MAFEAKEAQIFATSAQNASDLMAKGRTYTRLLEAASPLLQTVAILRLPSLI
jgi:hypothetical protein